MLPTLRRAFTATAILACCLALDRPGHSLQAATTLTTQSTDWPAYGGSPADDRYSPLIQINRTNVRQLRPAWTYDTGQPGGLQTNPLIIGRTLFGYTPTQQVFALDAATGRKLWTFDIGTPGLQPTRGLTYFADAHQPILFASILSFLYALNPATGQPISTFGEGGRIDLRKDLGATDMNAGFAAMTTPGVIYRDLLIAGFRLPETKPALHGDIRAFNVHTGKLAWSFHTIPHPGEPGSTSWPTDAWTYTGAANNWCGMALDAARGIVYVPTGSAVDDFYGGDRLGDDHFSDTLLALDAATGKRLWDFQGVHHDIWDRDFPSPPSLVTVRHDGHPVDAVAQPTKQGFLYLFDRVTGNPLFPIEERPFPASAVPGERTSPTQPVPLAPEPFARQRLTEDLLTTRTPEAHAYAVEQFKSFRSNGQFLPLAVDRQTVVFPGFDGGAEWGGSAVDTQTGVLYVNANDLAWTGGLTPNHATGDLGTDTYMTQCAVCHGGDRRGAPPAFPTLVGVHGHLTDARITAVIANGKGRMPAFPGLSQPRLTSLLAYLNTGATPASAHAAAYTSPDRNEHGGAQVYAAHCALCHSDDLAGAPSNYPGLLGVRLRLTDAQILANIHNGKGRMPALSQLSEADGAALLRFLGPAPEASSKQEAASTENARDHTSPYRFTGYRKFLDPDGYPAVKPPWGTLNAIDLNTGKYLWKIPLGNYPELASMGLADTGTENYGGPIVTAGGLVFIGATNFDHTFRAFDSSTGMLLWSADLPYAGNATPATYTVDGKQFLVIATSNARNPKAPQGAAYVAFALP